MKIFKPKAPLINFYDDSLCVDEDLNEVSTKQGNAITTVWGEELFGNKKIWKAELRGVQSRYIDENLNELQTNKGNIITYRGYSIVIFDKKYYEIGIEGYDSSYSERENIKYKRYIDENFNEIDLKTNQGNLIRESFDRYFIIGNKKIQNVEIFGELYDDRYIDKNLNEIKTKQGNIIVAIRGEKYILNKKIWEVTIATNERRCIDENFNELQTTQGNTIVRICKEKVVWNKKLWKIKIKGQIERYIDKNFNEVKLSDLYKIY